MKIFCVILTMVMSCAAVAKTQTRCGWISNPTPANYWLNDADGEWIISVQGGYQADGYIEAYPTDEQMVNTNGNYGYWCGCITGTFNAQTGSVVSILSSSVKNLDVCLEDPHL